jgi:MYXO-CTERM domain-containing protein
MRGTIVAILGAIGAFFCVLSRGERATACSVSYPPPALAGYPTEGKTDVPTDVVPVFAYFEANLSSQAELPRATFELVSDSGATIAATARTTYATHFELVFGEELAPRTGYVLHASLQTSDPLVTNELTLSFTTGDGPVTEDPAPPSARIQHYTSFGEVLVSSCGPNANSSCLFFQSPGPFDVVMVDDFGQEQAPHYLIYKEWTPNLSGVEQGTNFQCARLRTRAGDGTLSGAVDICHDDGESYPVTGDLTDLVCTESGLTRGGVPIGQAGGTGTGGSAGTGTGVGGDNTGGSDTGGSGTGGSATGGGGDQPDPDDEGSRTVMTEGCGCSVPGKARGSTAAAWMLLALAWFARRRSGTIPSVSC